MGEDDDKMMICFGAARDIEVLLRVCGKTMAGGGLDLAKFKGRVELGIDGEFVRDLTMVSLITSRAVLGCSPLRGVTESSALPGMRIVSEGDAEVGTEAETEAEAVEVEGPAVTPRRLTISSSELVLVTAEVTLQLLKRDSMF